MAKARGIGGARTPGGKIKPFGGKVNASPEARIVIAGRRVRMDGDGSYSRFTKPPPDSAKTDSRARNKRVRQARKAKRGAYRG